MSPKIESKKATPAKAEKSKKADLSDASSSTAKKAKKGAASEAELSDRAALNETSDSSEGLSASEAEGAGSDEDMDEELAGASSGSGGGEGAAALAAASSGTEMSASFKNFRHHPDMENFYRFIHDNDLRLEALEILDQVILERQFRKEVKAAKAQAH